MAVKLEDYGVNVREGDLVLSHLTLTGWGLTPTAVKDKTDEGVLHGRITTGNVFQLWKDPTFADATKQVITSAAISAAGFVDLTESNNSDFSGRVKVDYTLGDEQLFKVIVTYADEQDLARVYGPLDGELDADQKYEGQDARFESLLKEAKRLVDRRIRDRYMDVIGFDAMGRPRLGRISDPRELSRAHALMAAWLLYVRRTTLEPVFRDIKNDAKDDADDELAQVPVTFDAEEDGVIDNPDDDVTQECERG